MTRSVILCVSNLQSELFSRRGAAGRAGDSVMVDEKRKPGGRPELHVEYKLRSMVGRYLCTYLDYAKRVKSYNPLFRMVFLLYGVLKWALIEEVGWWMACRCDKPAILSRVKIPTFCFFSLIFVRIHTYEFI